MTTQAKPLPPIKLYAAFSGGAIDLLDTDPEIMGRSMERIVMLSEPDLSPDPSLVGVARLLAWDETAVLASVTDKIPDTNYAGKIVVNFETFERGLNPLTIDTMGRLMARIARHRPFAQLGWYGHPRRFYWPWLAQDISADVDGYSLAWMKMSNGRLGEAMTLLAPHQYPVGELVKTRVEQLESKGLYLAEQARLAIGSQTRWVHELARQEAKPVVWFVTPMKQGNKTWRNPKTGEMEDDYTHGYYSREQFTWWVSLMLESGVTDFGVWMHARPDAADQIERVRTALVEVVFPAFGV